MPNRRSIILLTVSLLHAGLVAAQTAGQAGGAPTTPASPIRLVRTLSGTQGEMRDGRFVILDPRTTFRLPEDAKIVVYFEWLGAPGKHLMVGTWRGPGNTSTSSSFEYVAKDRSFSAFWELTLPPNAPQGQWVLEATVDAMPAGVHAFEIVGADAAKPAIVPGRTPLTRPEVFARTLDGAVLVEALDAAGARIALAPGFQLSSGAVATALSAVDNAAALRIRSRQGHTREASALIGFDRRRGWAIVPVGDEPLAPVPTRSTADARPGEACYTTAVGGDGSLMVTPCEIVGTTGVSASDARLTLAYGTQPASPGAAVLNEFGELVGMVTEAPADHILVAQQAIRMGHTAEIPAAITLPQPVATPIAAFPAGPWPPATALNTLSERGVFIPKITLGQHVAMGGFTPKAPSKNDVVPADRRLEFSSSDKTMASYVTWVPAERLRGLCTLKLYDLDNTQRGDGQPHKINVRARQASMSVWSFAVPPPGVYRVDVLLDGAVAWRGYFRVKS